jgi:effector-binding domain-containing protein
MLTEPKIEKRSEQPYVAIRSKVTMNEIPKLLPPQIHEVFDWLNKHHIKPFGPPFFHYRSMGKDGQLIVEVGVAVQNPVSDDERVKAGAFVKGNYVVATHTGPYNGLYGAHMQIEEWIKNKGVVEKAIKTKEGPVWGSRTEFYPTDPVIEPNPAKWVTEIAVLVEEK